MSESEFKEKLFQLPESDQEGMRAYMRLVVNRDDKSGKWSLTPEQKEALQSVLRKWIKTLEIEGDPAPAHVWKIAGLKP